MEGERVNHTIPTNSIQEKESERERERPLQTTSRNESDNFYPLSSAAKAAEGREGGREGGRTSEVRIESASRISIQREGREGGR